MMCAEYSYFWTDGGGGDASISPYSNDEFSDVWASIAQFDRRSSFIIFSDITSQYTGTFKITVSEESPYGGFVHIGEGIAVIDGKAYRYTGSSNFQMRDDGYYRIYLEKAFEKQVVSLGMRFSSISLDDATIDQNDGDVWRVPLLTASVASGVLTVDIENMDGGVTGGLDEKYESRWFNTYPVLGGRQGGNASDWGTGGSTNYVVGPVRIEIGCVAVAASPTVVTFEEAFPNTPIVIIMPKDTDSDWSGNNLWISAIAAASFTVSLDSVTNFNDIFYIAIGPIV